ncbi:MAG: hypothetical protein ACREAB_00130 [Blastocatellia bacterium]
MFTVALFLILAAGRGIALLLLPRHRPTPAIEILCLALLFGAAFVSLASFALGFFITGWPLRLALTVCCLALLGFGWGMKPKPFEQRGIHDDRKDDRKSAWLLAAMALSLIGLVVWLSRLRTLGWDGLFNWEIKARIAFLNGGAIPLDFFSDPTRPWTLQGYPLLLPLTEAWFYGWMGSADQGMIKLLFPVFYAAALGLIAVGIARAGGSVWQTAFAFLLTGATPLTLAGDGSASSGYADFPLAVFYLAAVVYLIEYWIEDSKQSLLLLGCLAAIPCWVKQEGAVLWLCLIALAAIKIVQRRQARQLPALILPGLALLIGWRVFVGFVKPPTGDNFLPLTPQTLWNTLDRAPVIIPSAISEMLNWRHWGALWLIVAVSTLSLLAGDRRLAALFAAVIAPMALYCGIYFFSAWPGFDTHMSASFPRLLIHITPVAVMTAAIAAGPLCGHFCRRIRRARFDP